MTSNVFVHMERGKFYNTDLFQLSQTLHPPTQCFKKHINFFWFAIIQYNLDQCQIWEHAPESIEAIWRLEKSQLGHAEMIVYEWYVKYSKLEFQLL